MMQLMGLVHRGEMDMLKGLVLESGEDRQPLRFVRLLADCIKFKCATNTGIDYSNY